MKANLRHISSHVAVLSTMLSLAASGCSLPNAKRMDYRSTEKSTVSALEIPPDMVNAPENPAEVSRRVLAPVPGMYIERVDHAHWLVVDHKTPEQLWPQLREFWRAQGFKLSADALPRGVLETDWKTSRARLNQGVIRNTLSKVERLGNAYVSSEKNKYRTRLLAEADGWTWISIHHQGQRELLTGMTKETTQWRPAPNDPSLEVEYLQRLMYALAGESVPKALTDKGAPTEKRALKEDRATAPSAQAPVSARQRLEVPRNAPAQLNLNASFDQVWSQTGLALERANLTIAERDRMRGMYILRYDVAPSKPQQAKQTSVWRRIFPKKEDKQAQRYALKVQALDSGTTRIFIENTQGGTNTSTPARHILYLLAQQLKML